MRHLFVILSLALLSLSTLGEASKCDKKIIKKIKKQFWNKGHCVPRDLLRTIHFLSPEIVKATTSNYYPDEDKIVCLYSTIEDSTVKLFIQYEDCPTVYESPNVLNLVEKNGALIEEEKGIYRYHLYSNRFGVTAFYKCTKNGEEGPPEALVKVSAYGYEEEAFIQSIEDLASVGIYIGSKVFENSCVTQAQLQEEVE